MHNQIIYCVQLTPKTLADVKGVTLISYEGGFRCVCKLIVYFFISIIQIIAKQFI